MFQRTAAARWAARHLRPAAGLPLGRVEAAYVLAGSRLEIAGRGRRARTSWSTSRSRARQAIPSSRAISEAVEGVGGSANAATDRESTVYWARVPRRQAAAAMTCWASWSSAPRSTDADIDQERDGHRGGDPLLP